MCRCRLSGGDHVAVRGDVAPQVQRRALHRDWAAINPVLLFLLLRRLRERGYRSVDPRRPVADRDVRRRLGLLLRFGHRAGVVHGARHRHHVRIGYARASLDAIHPMLAGMCVGFGYASRTPMGFMVPFFVFEAVRASGGWARLRKLRSEGLPPGLLAKLVRFAIPAGAILGVLLVHNYLRFEQFTEFGHKYLNIGWQDRIQRWGLFNYHFLSRNLTCALLLLPRILTQYPYVKISEHGMSMLLTTPALGYSAAPKEKSPLALGLWLTILVTALPSLLYQNSGYLQFVPLQSRLHHLPGHAARGGWPPVHVALQDPDRLGVAVNLFGAIVSTASAASLPTATASSRTGITEASLAPWRPGNQEKNQQGGREEREIGKVSVEQLAPPLHGWPKCPLFSIRPFSPFFSLFCPVRAARFEHFLERAAQGALLARRGQMRCSDCRAWAARRCCLAVSWRWELRRARATSSVRDTSIPGGPRPRSSGLPTNCRPSWPLRWWKGPARRSSAVVGRMARSSWPGSHSRCAAMPGMDASSRCFRPTVGVRSSR